MTITQRIAAYFVAPAREPDRLAGDQRLPQQLSLIHI